MIVITSFIWRILGLCVLGLLTLLPVYLVWLFVGELLAIMAYLIKAFSSFEFALEKIGLQKNTELVAIAVTFFALLITGFLSKRGMLRPIVRSFERFPILGPFFKGFNAAVKKIKRHTKLEGNHTNAVAINMENGEIEIGFIMTKKSLIDNNPVLSIFVPNSPFPFSGKLVKKNAKDCRRIIGLSDRDIIIYLVTFGTSPIQFETEPYE